MGDEERREYVRMESVHLVNYILRDADGLEIKRGVSLSMDVSPGGMRIEVDENIPVNSKIELDVSIREEINHFEGEVVYVAHLKDKKGYSAGIKVSM